MIAEWITSFDALRALRAPLNELAGVCRARAYDFPSFLIPWAAAAGAQGQRPRCLVLRQGGEVLAFFPFFERRDPKALFARRLAPPRFGSSPPFEILIAPGADREAVLDAMADAVAGLGWYDQQFRDEPADGTLATCWLPRMAARGARIHEEHLYDYYIISGCADAEEYQTRLVRKKRRELQRQERRFLERGEMSLHTRADDITAQLPDMRTVIARSWKYTPHMARRALPLIEGLIAGMAPEGHIRLWMAHADGQAVSMLLEFADQSGSRHAYFNATDQEAGALDAGITLLFNACKGAVQDGVGQYDFWGYRPYIKQVSTGTRPIRSYGVTRSGALQGVQGASLRMAGRLRRRNVAK